MTSILGLPFTSDSTNHVFFTGACRMRFVTMTTNYNSLLGHVQNNSSKVELFQHGSGQSPIGLPSSALSNSSGQIMLSMFYYTS